MCYINYSTFWERTRKERKKKKSYISLTVLMGIFHRDSWPNCFEVGKLIFNNNNDYYIICCSLFICIIWRREDCVENQVFNKSNMQRIVLSARMVTFFFFFFFEQKGDRGDYMWSPSRTWLSRGIPTKEYWMKRNVY